ncbi:hypothetical protein V6N12_036024 [Hibiscus sabdariffa]|uniref:Endonuclease/exonuclease/phosphatase domain-containing protein n=1 Tax=Hibiscus sabdariffa TaxID=183260 RepID=A0ABR2EPF7_9ROSI
MFGPWMQAPSRKSWKVSESKAATTPENLSRGLVKVAASRFAVLSPDVNDPGTWEGDLDHVNAGVGDALLEVSKGVDTEGGLENGMVALGTTQEDNLVAIEMHESEKRLLLRGSGSGPLSKESNKGEQGGKAVVASKDVVVQELVTLNPTAHAAVRVVERGYKFISKKGGGRRCIIGLNDATAKVGLDEWVGNLERELEGSARGGESSSLGGEEQRMAETVGVQWQKNVSFDWSSKHPVRKKWEELWGHLLALQSSGDTTWVLGGDFNSILSSDERMGGSC